MLYKRRTPTSIIAWLLSMVLIPYFSVILYFIFGSRKRINRYEKENITFKYSKHNYNELNPIDGVLRSAGIAGAQEDQEFEIITDPTEAYSEFMSSIESATSSIYISTYVFKYDVTTKAILKALTLKAKSGVEVKLLIDSLGSWQLYFSQRRLKELRSAGAIVEFFMPILRMPFRNYINLRDHRKIYMFDEKKVLSGGMNLADEYLGEDPTTSRWDDMLFSVKGSSIEHFFNIFASDWLYASSKKITYKNRQVENSGNTYVQVVPSGPDVPQDALYEALLSAIYSAKKRIWIVTPYFIPDASLSQALTIASHRGVDVKLITPAVSNHLIADLTRSSFMRELEEAGVSIELYTGAMLHAKAVLFDELGAMLGSVNLDNRSLFLNYEIATFVYSEDVIDEIDQWMRNLLSSSSRGTAEVSKARRVFENFMRIFAPQM
ncbi:MAG: cardiolipin synthase [Helicobacteraceae bacterium]|nr:cardiolipin synthase [Helicobacteraceae bacterium]